MDHLDVGIAGSLVIVPAHVQRFVETGMNVNVSGDKRNSGGCEIRVSTAVR